MRLGRTVTLADAGLDRGARGRRRARSRRLSTPRRRCGAATTSRPPRCVPPQPVRGPAAIAPVFEWENPPDDLDVARHAGRRVGAEQVRVLRAARLRYERMYREAGGVPVRPRVVEFLAEHAAPLVKGAYDDATGRELYRAVGRADRGRRDLRLRRRPAGGRAAVLLPGAAHGQGVRRPRLRRVRGRAARQPGAVPGQQQAGHPVRRDRAARRPRHLSPALVTDLSTLQAKAYARIGDRAGCHARMTRAEEMSARIRPGEEPPETSYVQAGLVETQHADALRALGDLAAARSYAQQSVDAAGALPRPAAGSTGSPPSRRSWPARATPRRPPARRR